MGKDRNIKQPRGIDKLDFGSELLPTGGTENPWDVAPAPDVVPPSTGIASDGNDEAGASVGRSPTSND